MIPGITVKTDLSVSFGSGARDGAGMLALLLRHAGITDPETAARRLIYRYGSMLGVLSLDRRELSRLLGESAAMFVVLYAALQSRRITDGYKLGKVHTDEETVEFVRASFLGRAKETVELISFGADGRTIGIDRIGEGTINSSDVYPRRIVECAVARGADSVILTHNHPGGSSHPSNDDIVATAKLFATCRVAGIMLHRHIIVAGGDYFIMQPDPVSGEVVLVGRLRKEGKNGDDR